MKTSLPKKVVAIIVAAFFFLMVTPAYGQGCYDICTVLVKSEYQNIYYSGTVRTKEYVIACLPDGMKTTIPIINGIAPLINQFYSGDSVVYNLDYNFGEKWSGKKLIIYYDEDKQPKKMEKTPPTVVPPTVEKIPSPGMKKPSEITPKGS